MGFLKTFTVISDENENYIPLDAFYQFLKINDQNVPRLFNVKRTFKGYKGGIQTVNGQTAVPVSSVLRYLFSYSESSEGCQKITKQVEKELLHTKSNPQPGSTESSLSLYKLIAKTKFIDAELLFSKCVLDERRILTLVIDHKPLFTEKEWLSVCWFEHHFSKSVEKKFQDLQYDDIIKLKYEKFHSYLSLKDCSKNWLLTSSLHMKEKSVRIEAARDENQIEIIGQKRHKPVIIDNEIDMLFKEHCEDRVVNVFSFDTMHSVNTNTINACVEIKSGIVFADFPVNDICRRAFQFLLRRHDVLLKNVYFVHTDALASYKTEGSYSRFAFRDAIELQKFSVLAFQWDGTEMCTENLSDCEDDTEDACPACFVESSSKPLQTKTFNIVQEWFLDVPVETQILLEQFISARSISRARSPEQLLRQKLERLYQIFDVLLNTLNKKFIGIFQQSNTDALLIEFKSISSVFNITSAAGITLSLDAAEKKLRTKADNDLLYYNTFLKKHEIAYETTAGKVTTHISLQQCHPILMLDNLVRFSDKPNVQTNPGMRGNQLCTLPLTVQGLPKNASIIEEQWHGFDCPQTVAYCQCKQPQTLSQQDLDRVLLQLTDKEKKFKTQFGQLMLWGYNQLWKNMTDDVSVYVGSGTEYSIPDALDNILEEADIKNLPDSEDQTGENEDNIDILNIIGVVKLQEEEDAELPVIDENQIETLHEISDNDAAYEIESEERESDIENEMDSIQIENEQNYNNEFSELDKSLGNLSLNDEKDPSELDIVGLLKSFGFSKFVVPPLLCRHPPPEVGRDDDVSKIKDILDDILLKLGFLLDPNKKGDKILCGPDNKIGKCLIQLRASNVKYESFLPEFPLLHLRKSKITILFSAYKDAGLVQLVRIMRDDEKSEWSRLVSLSHIDVATRHIKRLALSFQLALLVSFSQTLEQEELENFLGDMESLSPMQVAENWNSKFEQYVDQGRKKNATFALHCDMLNHCNHVIAISLAERLGGSDGYTLLLYAVKESLLFSFLNNASSYAPYCVQLLHSHFSAGYFHRRMKETLFTTPIRTSNRNFACDTKRELDHLEALKGFRSGSNINSATVRMSLIDSLNEAFNQDREGRQDTDNLGWDLTQVDENHIFPTVSLILRRNGLSLEENNVPFNVYSNPPIALPLSILDEYSYDTGKYLMQRYVCQKQLFGFTGNDLKTLDIINGPSELKSRAKRSKGITIKRLVKSKIAVLKTEKQLKEAERQKSLAKQIHLADCFSSENNTCQALVKPDSSKRKVAKSLNIPRALRNMLTTRLQAMAIDTRLDDIMKLNYAYIPNQISRNVKLVIVEFAGFKFKVKSVKTGREYLQAANSTLQNIVKSFPNVSTLVVCEEKYCFTPDEFKAGTRAQRQSAACDSVAHLKSGDRTLSDNFFNKDAVTQTVEGKKLISRYLAENIAKLSFDQNIEVVVDSELHLNCRCKNDPCICKQFCTPVKCQYSGNAATISLVEHIIQRKGEAEMSQLDWLISARDDLKEGEAVASIVTSGDIDAIYVHMFVVGKYWPRYTNMAFKNSVFVILQKKGTSVDIYNVTKMLEVLERSFADPDIGMKLAVSICMGGNDFIPTCHHISHDTIQKLFVKEPYRRNLFIFLDGKMKINQQCFIDFYKELYCPKRYDSLNYSFEEVRAMTIAKVADEQQQSGFKTKDPRLWLPPESALLRLLDLLQLQVQYLETAGDHSACLPDFLSSSCLQKNSCGEIEYSFGPDAHFTSFKDLPDQSLIRKPASTASKKDRKKYNKIQHHKREHDANVNSLQPLEGNIEYIYIKGPIAVSA